MQSYAQDTIYTYSDSEWNECAKEDYFYYGKTFKTDNNLWGQLDYFKNGQLQMIGAHETAEQKVKQGLFIYFDENGDTTGIYNYVDNVKEGKYVTFFDNGNRDIETTLADGLQEGLTNYYHENGKLSSTGDFSKGSRIGEWKYYDKSGEYISNEHFIQEYTAPCGYQLKLPARWIHSSKDEYGKTVQGISIDRIFRKGVRDNDSNEQFYALDAICFDERNLTPESVCKNMAKMEGAKMKKVKSYKKLKFQVDEFYAYTKKGDNGETLQVLLFAEAKGKDIAQLKFTFDRAVDPEALSEMVEIVNSLSMDY